MNNFLKDISEGILVFDGSKGTMLQKFGLKGGECPELWNIEHSDKVSMIYDTYKKAGSNVIQTNTFQGNRLKLSEYGLENKTYELNFYGVVTAKKIMGKDGYVAASIGPLGKLFVPSGDLTFEQAYDIFKEQVLAVTEAGADIINFETFTDLAEMRAALLAAKENSELPVICSMAFETNGRTLMGNDPGTCAVVLKSMGADMVGANCSMGPKHMIEIIRKMYETGEGYFCVKPNAGFPEIVGGSTVYRDSPEYFAETVKEFVKYGSRLIGGCCGTTAEYIKEIKKEICCMEPVSVGHVSGPIISSAVKMLNLSNRDDLIIGRIDVSKDRNLLTEIESRNFDYIIDCVMDMAGCDIIYINIDNIYGKAIHLQEVVDTVQTYSKEPIIIESKDIDELNLALRTYKGKAGVVIDDTDDRDLGKLINIIKKYGGTIVTKDILKLFQGTI